MSINAFRGAADCARGILMTAMPILALAPTSGSWAQDSATASISSTEPEAIVAAPTDADANLDVIPVDTAEQNPTAEKGAETPRNRLVEEVIVTAQKREEKLQDVPISIQAFGGDLMDARGIETTDQLGQAVPSLQFTGVAGFTLIYMRGIGTDNFIPSADPSIATYIDGIYIPLGHTVGQSLGTIERVEVLKGPQGTLFGRNATGGAISIVTRDPGDVFAASAETELGNYNSRTIKASASGPITDWLGASVDVLHSTSDSYYNNVLYGVQDNLAQALRAKVLFRPTDDLSLSLTAYNTKGEGVGTTIGKNTNPSLVGRLATIPTTPEATSNDFTAVSDFEAGSKSSQEIYYGTLSWKLPAFDVKVLGSDEYILTDYANIDFDGSPRPLAAFDTTNEYSDFKTAELQLLSNDTTWMSDKLQWVAGVYYLKGKAGVDPATLTAAPGALQAVDAALAQLQLPIPIEFTKLINRLLPLGTNPLTDGVRVGFEGVMGTRSLSAYAQGTYYFTDWVDLTLGGRLQKEKRYLIESRATITNPLNSNINSLITFDLDERTEENFSPKAVLTFRPRENSIIYLSYSAGFKSGTFNIVNIYTPPNYIVPEKVTSYELGSKTDFLDGRLRINVAAFYNDIENLQSGFVSLLTGGAVRFLTAGGARTRGVEADGTLIPFPEWNPGFAMTGNAAYVDSTYTSFKNGPGFDEVTGIYQGNLDHSGNEIVRAPKLSGGLGMLQAIELSNGELEFALDGYYNSGYYYDAKNTVEEKEHFTLGTRVSYLYNPWNVRVTAFGKNILDEKYNVQQFQTDFGIIKTRAAPVEYGVRVGWEF